jgi:transcription elongation GreA/GreB family factor
MATHHESNVSAMDARCSVPMDRRQCLELSAERIAMNSYVTYVEEPRGDQRSVTLVHPVQAKGAEERVSLFSPLGRALLGHSPGTIAYAKRFGRRAVAVRILSVKKLQS